ncbi:MAG TPA: hypothetical protein DEF45_14920 [Rhodopirellula sp.]|nr:hypothetical protein [Rhodopirellula sp.]
MQPIVKPGNDAPQYQQFIFERGTARIFRVFQCINHTSLSLTRGQKHQGFSSKHRERQTTT